MKNLIIQILQLNLDHCVNSVIFSEKTPKEAVEKNLSAPHFRCKLGEKRVNFICLLPTRRDCRSLGVVEAVIRPPLGPLPTGLLKPSKVLVTNDGDKVCEVVRRDLFREISSNAHRKIWSFGKKSPILVKQDWDREGYTLCRRTNDCAKPG